MITADSVSLMTDREKLDLIGWLAESDDWQEVFEPVYRTLMDDDNSKVREAAIVALWDLADPRHIEPLTAKVEYDPDVEVRAKAASVLGIYIYEGMFGDRLEEEQFLAVRKLLLDLAQDPDEAMIVRRMAIEALSFDTDEPVQELIDWAYRHASIEMKMTAIFAMGRSGNVAWFDTILDELDAEDPRLQIEAVHAAGEAGLTIATPKIRNLVGSSNRELQLAAVWALARTGGPGALETLEMCAESDDAEIRRVAGQAIQEFYRTDRAEGEHDDYGEGEF